MKQVIISFGILVCTLCLYSYISWYTGQFQQYMVEQFDSLDAEIKALAQELETQEQELEAVQK